MSTTAASDASAAPGAPAPVLPELRQDIQLYRGPYSRGNQVWLVYDPVRHRYFQISQRAFRLLSIWRPQPARAFCEYASTVLVPPVTMTDVEELSIFIVSSNLAVDGPGGDATAFARQEKAVGHTLIWRVIHNYLFFKIPLFRPARFLASTMPLVSPLFTRATALVVLLVAITGGYFASRQWEQFVTTFLDFLSFEGILAYGLTLVVIKTLHELGHAYTATRYGLRVNTMGVAFIVLMPVLYTDVTDAWRLKRRRQKLAIDSAGVIVELGLAGIALFLWAFLPEGSMRSAAFTTATVSLVMGLAINLNPLMRFDGYHMLADAWNMPNLQPRSSALGVWRLREFLFALGRPPPERFGAHQQRLIIAYATCVFVYRQFLFIGIAIAVYHMFFKALGVILFGIEIVWFVLLPVLREFKEWWSMRDAIIETRRSRATLVLAGALLILFIVPWRGNVSFQAVIGASSEFVVFAPRPAQVVDVHLGDEARIHKGDQLITLFSPDLERDLRQARLRLALIRLRLQRIAGDTRELPERLVLKGELARGQEVIAGLQKEMARLLVSSPFDGVVRDVDVDLKAGAWIDAASPVARIVAHGPPIARGYVDEDALFRMRRGAKAIFIPEDPLRSALSGVVDEVVETGSRSIEWRDLSSVYGGAIASDAMPEGGLQPRSGKHLVRVKLDATEIAQTIRGTLHVDGQPESFAASVWRQVLRVLVREAGA